MSTETITMSDKSEFTPQYWENYNYLYRKFTKVEMAPVIAQAKGYSTEYVTQWSKKIMTHCLMREIPHAIPNLRKGVTAIPTTVLHTNTEEINFPWIPFIVGIMAMLTWAYVLTF